MNAALSIEALHQSLLPARTGILVVGHGTRKPAGQSEFLRLVEHIAALVPQLEVEGAFLELAEPDIAQGVSKLSARGCQGLVVIPVLLFYAGHARTDIPDAVRTAADRCGIEFVGMSAPLDTHKGVLALSQQRFEQALATHLDAPPPSEFPTSSEQGRGGGASVALAMVGRGTSDQAALGRMREFTRLRSLLTPVQWSQTGFFAGGAPKIESLFEQAAVAGPRIVIVQPHLLFEGELMDQLRELVSWRQRQNPHQSWRLAATLGAEKSLASVFLTILAERIAERFAQP